MCSTCCTLAAQVVTAWVQEGSYPRPSSLLPATALGSKGQGGGWATDCWVHDGSKWPLATVAHGTATICVPPRLRCNQTSTRLTACLVRKLLSLQQTRTRTPPAGAAAGSSCRSSPVAQRWYRDHRGPDNSSRRGGGVSTVGWSAQVDNNNYGIIIAVGWVDLVCQGAEKAYPSHVPSP